ncbi:Allantoicase [Blattella germanica]|nr:Allantoicase [Blattella germanica]
MDGWETRRKRIPGHDWAIIKLEEAAIPCRNSRMGSAATNEMLQQIAYLRTEDWKELIPVTQLNGGYKDSRYNHYKIDSTQPWTHVRLNIYPDGGVARLRLYGEAHPNWSSGYSNKQIDLIAMVNGGVCVGYSDAHYGHPRNIIGPGRGIDMGDGWETARRLDRPHVLKANRRGILQVPGSEWAVFRLGHRGIIKNIEVDTNHFRGNFPDSILIEGAVVASDDWSFASWQTLLPHQKVSLQKSF